MSITMALSYDELDIPAVSANYMNNVALVHAATVDKSLQFHDAAQAFFWDILCNGKWQERSPKGRVLLKESPMLGSTVTAAALAAAYVNVNQNWDFMAAKEASLLQSAPPLLAVTNVLNTGLLIAGLFLFQLEQVSFFLGRRFPQRVHALHLGL